MNNKLKTAVETFVTTYAQRNTETDFATWLSEQLGQSDLANEIIEGVAAYDSTLADLNSAIDSGLSKEEWLAKRMDEVAAEMPYDEVGETLSLMENSLASSNSRVMGEAFAESETAIIETDKVPWNEYSIKQKIFDVGQQAAVAGLSATAEMLKANIEGGETVQSAIGVALQSGIETARCEVKAVVASAVKSVAEEGLTDFLPADTPVETICGMAGAAVESAGALFDAATGKCTLSEAMEKTNRATFAATCRMGIVMLTQKATVAVMAIPVVGPPLAIIGNVLLKEINIEKFTEEAYAVVKSVRDSVWNGIKQTVGGIFNKVKQSVFQ